MRRVIIGMEIMCGQRITIWLQEWYSPRFQGRDQQVREKTERWMQLAALAATEQDPQKLSELIREIDRLLQEKQDRLNAKQIHPKPSE